MMPDGTGSDAGSASTTDGGAAGGAAGANTIEGNAGETSTGSTPGVYDPEAIYLFGTLLPTTCLGNAVALLSQPNFYTVGFGCYVNNTSVQIWNNQLVYHEQSSVIRIFVPDDSGSTPPAAFKYPEDPAKNDTIVDTAPCPSGDKLAPGFLSSPDGRLIYACADGVVWYEAGKKVYDGGQPGGQAILALGFDGLALVTDNLHGFGVMNLSDGVVLRATGFDNVGTVRAHKDGFHFVVAGRAGSDHPDPALWKIDTSGYAEQITTYPNAPPTLGDRTAKLMSNDDLYALRGDFADDIVRFTPQGTSELVYTESTHPNVQMQLISSMFTGP